MSYWHIVNRPTFKVYGLFAWYDFWVGVFFDRRNKRVYILPLPMFGIVAAWGEENRWW